VPEGAERAQARREVDDVGLRVEPARPGAVHRGHRPRSAAQERLRQGRRRGRGLRARLSAGAAPTSTSPCCGSPTSSARTSRPAHRLLLAARSCRRAGLRPAHPAVHEDDGIEVLRLATDGGPPGIFNVGGTGCSLLSQAIRLMGRPSFPVPSPAVGPGRPACSAGPASSTSRRSRCRCPRARMRRRRRQPGSRRVRLRRSSATPVPSCRAPSRRGLRPRRAADGTEDRTAKTCRPTRRPQKTASSRTPQKTARGPSPGRRRRRPTSSTPAPRARATPRG
jgi:hypothetical protein